MEQYVGLDVSQDATYVSPDAYVSIALIGPAAYICTLSILKIESIPKIEKITQFFIAHSTFQINRHQQINS